jgi:ATP-binding cassette subfamily B protein
MTGPRWHRDLMRYAGAYRSSLAGGVALIVLQALVAVAIPWPTKLAVDNVLRDRPLPGSVGWIDSIVGDWSQTALLVLLGVVSVLLVATNSGLNIARRVWRRSLGIRMTNDLAHDTLDLVQRRSPVAPELLRSGDLVQRIVTDTKCIDVLVFGVWMTAIQSVVTFGILAAIMLSMSSSLAVVAVVVAVPMLVIIRAFRDRMQRNADEVAKAQADVTTAAEQMLSTLPEIQSFGAEDAELARFSRDARRQLDTTVRSQRTSAGFQVAIGSVTATGTGSVMLVGGLLALDGVLTIGDLLVFISYLTTIYGPVEGLAYLAQAWATARSGAVRVLGLSTPEAEVPEPIHPVSFPVTRRGATVQFDGVTFGYREGTPVLQGIDIDILEGETVAIVGRTGAGKSSLVALLPRFFDPWSGAVRLDGVDVRAARVRDVRRRVALVRQDPLLLPVSIRENIAYGTPEADLDRIESAARQALATEFIDALPDGYDTIVGERGVTLSGGQRQRLAIARALCRDAPILILDEPTAALDAESELRLLELVQEAALGRTILMVAHRLSTLRSAHRILVMEHGRVVEEGSHDLLLRENGIYAGYVRLQARSSDPDAWPEASTVPTSGGR